jgi:hypothetical protein
MPFFQSLVIWDRSAESRIIIRHGCFSNVEKKLSDDASLCFCQGELQNFRKFGALQVSSALFSEQFGDFSVMQPRRQGVSLAMGASVRMKFFLIITKLRWLSSKQEEIFLSRYGTANLDLPRWGGSPRDRRPRR